MRVCVCVHVCVYIIREMSYRCVRTLIIHPDLTYKSFVVDKQSVLSGLTPSHDSMDPSKCHINDYIHNILDS